MSLAHFRASPGGGEVCVCVCVFGMRLHISPSDPGPCVLCLGACVLYFQFPAFSRVSPAPQLRSACRSPAFAPERRCEPPLASLVEGSRRQSSPFRRCRKRGKASRRDDGRPKARIWTGAGPELVRSRGRPGRIRTCRFMSRVCAPMSGRSPHNGEASSLEQTTNVGNKLAAMGR